VIATIGATSAMASDGQFIDVPKEGAGSFAHDPAEWAAANGLTTGCNSPGGGVIGDNFCPLDNVTRGQNITFTYRHHTELIEPLLADIEADIADIEADIVAAAAAAAANADDIEGGRQHYIEYLNPAIGRNDAGDDVTTFEINETNVVASGDGDLVFPLDKPYSMNSTNWVLLTVSPCFELSGGAVVDAVRLWNQVNTGSPDDYSDTDDVASSGCVPLFPPGDFSDGHLSLEIELKDGGEATIHSLIVWWVHPDSSLLP